MAVNTANSSSSVSSVAVTVGDGTSTLLWSMLEGALGDDDWISPTASSGFIEASFVAVGEDSEGVIIGVGVAVSVWAGVEGSTGVVSSMTPPHPANNTIQKTAVIISRIPLTLVGLSLGSYHHIEATT